jgi:hypothetical protein
MDSYHKELLALKAFLYRYFLIIHFNLLNMSELLSRKYFFWIIHPNRISDCILFIIMHCRINLMSHFFFKFSFLYLKVNFHQLNSLPIFLLLQNIFQMFAYFLNFIFSFIGVLVNFLVQ